MILTQSNKNINIYDSIFIMNDECWRAFLNWIFGFLYLMTIIYDLNNFNDFEC
jgi:hypothetical protein